MKLIYKIDPINPDPKIIAQAAELLSENKIIAAPTETRYGFLVRADESSVLDKLYKIKGRPTAMPTAVFVNDIIGLSQLAEFDSTVGRLAEEFWPGAVTMVLKAVANLDEPVVVNEKIGLRCSTLAVIRALVDAVDFPLTATSANLSGKPDFEKIEEIADCFGDKVDLYLDGGTLTGEPSTVIEVSDESLTLLREGHIPFKSIIDIWERVE